MRRLILAAAMAADVDSAGYLEGEVTAMRVVAKTHAAMLGDDSREAMASRGALASVLVMAGKGEEAGTIFRDLAES
ncbi:MAG: hypothetical protein LBQ12_00585 [Deltaproteobacteria bacterium]|jgi:hypothetical protein|nr:hypothetical protein [Deltaproteobacteria bacterium]